MAEKWPKIAQMAQKLPKMAQKLAPAKKNSSISNFFHLWSELLAKAYLISEQFIFTRIWTLT